MKNCHLFACGVVHDSLFICAAMPEKITIMKYDQRANKFNVRKEVRTGEPCSCLLFTQNSLLAGTDRIYQIDMEQFKPDEFLDSTDTSIANAVFGASRMQSFPIAAVCVSQNGEPEEFLLCFNEFGIFVDATGRRSRDEDMKRSRLPLAFSYQAPYLYVAHFNSMEVCEIKPKEQQASLGIHTFMNVHSPRCVGPAVNSSAIYAATHYEHTVELMCIQGNATINESSKEETDNKVRHKFSVRRDQSTAQSVRSMKRPMSEDSYNMPPEKVKRTSSIHSTVSSLSSSFRSTASSFRSQTSSFRSTSTKTSASGYGSASLRNTLPKKMSTIRRSPRFSSTDTSSSSDDDLKSRCSSVMSSFTTPTNGNRYSTRSSSRSASKQSYV